MRDDNKANKQGQRPSSKRIIIIIIIIGAFLFVVTTLFWGLSKSVQNSIVDSNAESMMELAQHDLNSIRNSIVLRWENMEGVARELSEAEYEDANDLLSVLKRRARDIPSATKISLMNSEGTNFLSNGVVETNSYLADVCSDKTKRFVVRLNTNAHFSENIHEVLFEAVPVDFTVGENHFTWLVSQFPINTLEDELRITSYNEEGYSSIIDMQGNYIINMSRSHSFMSYDNFFNDMSDADIDGYDSMAELFADNNNNNNNNNSAAVFYTKDGQENIMIIEKMKIADWYFLSTVPISVFEAQTREIMKTFSILFSILALIVAGAFVMVVRQRKQQVELQIAEATSRSKTEFLFNMSHDIRTPMNAILGNTDIAIKHRNDQERVDESLGKIKLAGEHLLNLINDILEMSRIESGKLEISEEPMDLRELVTDVEIMSSSLAIKKSIDLQTVTDDLAHPYVYSDKVHANEVMINLVTNAIKYTPEGGRVRVSVSQPYPAKDGMVVLRYVVSDNGIGMSEEFQKHLFESFAREKTSTVSGQEGSGLGLSIVKKILDLAGGTISVKSCKGEGSEFTVEIPVRIMDEAAIKSFEDNKQKNIVVEGSYSLKGRKVLLAEDNEMNREIATDILEDAGMILETVEDGEFAVKAVAEKGMLYYDFVLMDIQMPVMNGYEATQAIRSMPDGDKLTIIALSANAFKEDIEKSLAAGMNAHVSKPISVPVLLETMNRLAK